ncbi:MAG: M14 family zinc carboxypeptidase [Armatimonadota bacterium]
MEEFTAKGKRVRLKASRFFLPLATICCLWGATAPLGSQSASKPPLVRIETRNSPNRLSPYARLVSDITGVKHTNRFRFTSAGYSVKGRPIPLVIMTPLQSRILPETRILIICGQHGDESSSPRAALSLIKRCALGVRPPSLVSAHTRGLAGAAKLNLNNVLWLVVPVANPDGFDRGKRDNAAGADLNRDWTRGSQPETRAIRRVFNTWKPHLVLDLHQWSPDDPPPAANGLEMTLRPDSPHQQWLERELAISALRCVNSPARAATLVTSQPTSDTSLAHKYFASRHAASFLIETSANSANRQRISLLTDLIVLTSSYVASMPKNQKAEYLTSGRGFNYSKSFTQWIHGQGRPSPGEVLRDAQIRVFWVIGVLCVLLLIVFRVGATRSRGSAGGHRFLRSPSLLKGVSGIS